MKKYIYSIVVLTFLFISCTEGFEELNHNKNQPESVNTEHLLPTVLFDLASLTTENAYTFTDVITQYVASYDYNQLDLYKWQGDDRFWSPMYSILENVKDIKLGAQANEDKNSEAVALILESYIFSIITDSYGDVPMSEANKTVEGITSPKYDKQQDIYTAIFGKLEEANEMINVDETITGDLMYSGDMNKWKKFANSLHLRLLLHTSGVQNVTSEMTKIIGNSSKYPLFTSNDDNAIYSYTGVYPNISPVSKASGARIYDYNLKIPTQEFIDLIKNNDPRLELWVSPRAPEDAFAASDRLQGALAGKANIGTPDMYSRRSDEFFTNPTKINSIFMTYSELNFILSEAKQKGFITTGSAKEFYDKGVTASFTQWGLEMPANFLTDTAPYNVSSDILYEQKWLALYHTGIESWLDFKRTGKPEFIKSGPDAVGSVPVRLLYPGLEQSVNNANYQAASAVIGGDKKSSSSWWW